MGEVQTSEDKPLSGFEALAAKVAKPGAMEKASGDGDGDAGKSDAGYASAGYKRDEVVSAFIKEMRLRNYDKALWWLVVLFRCKEGAGYVLKRLAIFAAEDVHHMPTLTCALAAYNAAEIKGADWNAVMRVFDFVMAPEALRFWETQAIRDFQRKWWIFEDKFSAKKDFPEIPMYALDVHTVRGRDLKKAKQPYGWRYSGTAYGQKSMMDEFQKNGKLSGNWDGLA